MPPFHRPFLSPVVHGLGRSFWISAIFLFTASGRGLPSKATRTYGRGLSFWASLILARTSGRFDGLFSPLRFAHTSGRFMGLSFPHIIPLFQGALPRLALLAARRVFNDGECPFLAARIFARTSCRFAGLFSPICHEWGDPLKAAPYGACPFSNVSSPTHILACVLTSIKAYSLHMQHAHWNHFNPVPR